MSDEYVKSEQILETRWRCPSCGQDNRGRDMTCPGCGAPKDEASAYTLDEQAAVVDDEKLVEEARAGAHWVCAYCEKQNRGRKDVCRFCGADQTLKPGEAPPPLPPAKRPPSLLLGCGVLLLLGVGFLGFLYWLGSPEKVEVKVAALKWEQALHLHERTLAHGDGWQDQVPGDAFDSKCERQQRTTREVIDHYRTVSRTRQVRYQSGTREDCWEETENLANGYASRKTVCRQEPVYDYRDEHYTEEEPVYRTEPVYDQYCRYKIYEWPIVKDARRQGEGHGGYQWPETSELGQASCTPCAQKDAMTKRCCSQTALYTVAFERVKPSDDPAKQKPVEYVASSVEDYETFKPGDAHVLEIDGDQVTVVRDE